MQNNLLIELGTEELPPKALSTLAAALHSNLTGLLQDNDFSFSGSQWYATPRRLAVYVQDLIEAQPDKVVEKRGPAVSAAFDGEGNPTKAAQGWARSNGIEVAQAQRLKTDKGEWLLHKADVKGESIDAMLAGFVQQALAKLPIPKPMRWGANTVQFIRPVHSLCMLYGERLIDGEVMGLRSGRQIQGHRFHGEKWLTLNDADSYLSTLHDSYVMADFTARKANIAAQIQTKAQELGAVVEPDEDLLEEVTALVEWPVALVAGFEQDFLAVPKEALIYTMKDDQRYFPLLDQHGQLLPKFIFISNIESKDPQKVTAGNEKVIRPRLADAQFFFESDKKQSLESRFPSLEKVLFQKQLGSLKDKSERIAELSAKIAELIDADIHQAKRAGQLCKTDLMTEVVMEFPDVQGVMGMHYARLDGEPEAVALAMNEHYMPRYAGDHLPSQAVGRAVALADKLDTLAGIFGIGMLPKGDKDPFALRRAAIGLLRIIIEAELPLDLSKLVALAVEQYGDKLSNADTQIQVVDFVLSRVKALYQDQGTSVDVIQAVFANKPTQPADFAARIQGVTAFKQLASASTLAAANKRVANILAKNQVDSNAKWQQGLLQDTQEQALAAKLSNVKTAIQPLLTDKDYQGVLQHLAQLGDEVDAFFDNVMVMADDNAVRDNRLALLADLRQQFLHVADISLLSA